MRRKSSLSRILQFRRGGFAIKVVCIALFCMLFHPGVIWATNYYVKTSANGGNNANSGSNWDTAKATIGAAMTLVDGNDAVHVAAGTYNEKVTFPGHNNVKLLGGYPAGGQGDQDPSNNTTIINGDGLPSGAVIYIPSNGDDGYSGIMVDGFTIKNGTHSGDGAAGIECLSLGVTITRNIIESNNATGSSSLCGGISIWGSLNDSGIPEIEQNIIRNNSAARVGGIFLAGDSSRDDNYVAYLVNNLIYLNSSTDTGTLDSGTGGVFVLYPASASIVNCTITGNTAANTTRSVAGVHVSGFTDKKGVIAMANSIIWHPDDSDDIYVDPNGTLWMTYCDVEDTGNENEGTGVTHNAPLFVDSANGDYHLDLNSSCVDAGSPDGTVMSGIDEILGIKWHWKPLYYSEEKVTLTWGDDNLNLSGRWKYYSDTSAQLWGTSESNWDGSDPTWLGDYPVTADPSSGQTVTDIYSENDVSGYSYSDGTTTASYSPYYPDSNSTVFWRGLNGYYGAWKILAIGKTTYTSSNGGDHGHLRVKWYLQANGSANFYNGIRNYDLGNQARPNALSYDLGVYEYQLPSASTLYVDAGASSSGHGMSWETAYSNLQDALTHAENSEGSVSEIHVAQGTYNGNFSYVSDSGQNLAVLGGYDRENDYTRVIDPTNTILDAGGSGRVLKIHNTGGGNITVEGFTLQNGVGGENLGSSATGAPREGGAGLWAYAYSETSQAGDIVLANNIISNNHCRFYNYGGGIYAYSQSASGTAGSITLTENVITGNRSTHRGAGGLYIKTYSPNEGGNITLTDNEIMNNNSPNNEGGGGSIYAFAGGEIILTNNTVSGNNARSSAGGLWLYTTSRGPHAGGDITLTGNTITGNTAGGDGGGIYAHLYGHGTENPPIDYPAGNITFENNTITGNTSSEGEGGGIRVVTGTWKEGIGGDVTFIRNLIARNSAKYGGAVKLQTDEDDGGNIFLTNNTITGNTTTSVDYGGGAVYMFADYSGSTIDLYNNIIQGNTLRDVYLRCGGTASAYNNDYHDLFRFEGYPPNPIDLDNEVGNIDADPLFVDPDGPDDDPATVDDNDYHLQVGSPCIDTGEASYDYSNEPSPNGCRINMGIYGNTDETTVSSDPDGDDYFGACDNCPNVSNSNQEDGDEDGVGDACDNCPDDPDKSEPGQCGCGVADTDSDSDMVADCIDAFPGDPDESVDTDGDGIGNNADTDDDNDGMPDEWENLYSELDPLVDDANNDPDEDLCPNIVEYYADTDPMNPYSRPIKGDINADNDVNLMDTILALQVLTSIELSSDIAKGRDVNGDGTIGLAEAIYALQIDSELRTSLGRDVSGEYIGINFNFEPDPFSALTSLSLNTNGTGTCQDVYTSDGDLETGSFNFLGSNDGLLMVSSDGELHGIVNTDSTIFNLVDTGSESGITVGIKKSSGMSNASLHGEYIGIDFSFDTEPWSGLSTLTLGGNGNGTYENLYTSEGDLESGSFTYTVSGDGTLTVNAGSDVLHGIVSADGTIFHLVNTGSETGITVGIKKSSGMSNARLNGEYIGIDFSFDTEPWSGLSTLTLDGNGNGTYQDLYSFDGELESGSFTYSMANDGTLTVNAGSDVLHGIVSADGSSFNLVHTVGGDIGITVGMKRAR